MKWNKEVILQSGILEQYVLGLLDNEEVAEVEAILKAHPELWDYVKNLRITLTAVSFQNGVRPPVLNTRNKEGEIALSGGTKKSADLAGQRRPAHWFSWLLLATLAGLNVYLAAKHQALLSQHSQLEHHYSSTQTRLHHYQSDHATMGLIIHQATHLQEIKGEYEGQVCRSWIIINEIEGKAYWKAGDMPSLNTGQAFAIWAQIDGEMVPCSSDIIKLDDLVELNFYPEAESFHITIVSTAESYHIPNTEMIVASGASDIRMSRAAVVPAKSL